MRQVSDVSGAVLHSTREYEIDAATKVVIGQVVKLAEGKVVPALAAETGAILGYAMENHPGTEDALNTRANGKRIIVQDAPGALAASPAPRVTATGGTETTITASGVAAFTANVFKGGFVKSLEDGLVREITASAVASGVLTLTVEKGRAPVEGEEFVLFPPRGFVGGNLAADGRKLVLTATANLPLMVVGRDEANNEIWTVAVKHVLAAGR